MRFGSVSALALAAFALAACEGTPTTGSSASNANLSMCGLFCPDPVLEGNPAPPAPPVVDPADPTNTNTGNTTNLGSGDTTIVLENAVVKSPTGGSLSRLTLTSNTAPVLDTARIEIDTNTANNSSWPIPKVMDENEFGTNASLGEGLGGTYKEYNILNDASSDEVLQVWTWGDSYATQYREEAGGGNARRQAWSFGGTRTTMPMGGTVNYTGTYGATATTFNWVESTNPGKTVDTNNVWRIEGTSNITADFATRQLNGTLSANTWTARRSTDSVFQAVDANNPADPNYAGFMNHDIFIQGQINGNTVSGKASLDPSQGWTNGTNPMYAGFFGDTGAGHEVAGAFNFLAARSGPVGGSIPINDPGKGYVQQSGVFHGCNPVCPDYTP